MLTARVGLQTALMAALTFSVLLGLRTMWLTQTGQGLCPERLARGHQPPHQIVEDCRTPLMPSLV